MVPGRPPDPGEGSRGWGPNRLPMSDGEKWEAAAFASIAARLGDLGLRRLRWTVAAVSAAVLVTGVLALVVVLRASWAAVAAFTLTFVVGLVAGLALKAPALVGRSR